MRLPVVELDYQALVAPEDVDFVCRGVQRNRCVELGRRRIGGKGEAPEARFELLARDARAVGGVLEGRLELSAAGAAGVSVEQRLERLQVEDPQVVGLADRALELGGAQDGREVEQRSCDGGRRDPVELGDLIRPRGRRDLDLRC